MATIPVIAIPIAKLHPSPFNPRVRQNRAALDELKGSMKEKGILTALIVRPNADGYEIIAGSRRLAAAKEMGWEDLPCVVHELTDEEAAEIALVDNLQRQDMDPLDEARGFVALAKKNPDIAAISAKVGKSRSYIAQRMKLVELLPAGQKALEAGKLEVGAALEIAKLPVDAQKDLILKAQRGYYSTISGLRRAIEWEVMLDLSGAPWKKDDAELVSAAGACNVCSKRTGSDRDLFGEAGKHDRCLDGECFRGKSKAFIAGKRAELEVRGEKVVQISSGYYVNPEDRKVLGAVLTTDDYLQASKTCKDPIVGLVVHGKGIGTVKLICTGGKCRSCGHSSGRDSSGTSSSVSPQARYKRRMEIWNNKVEQRVRERLIEEVVKRKADDQVNMPAILGAALYHTLDRNFGSDVPKRVSKLFDVKLAGKSHWAEHYETYMAGVGKLPIARALKMIAVSLMYREEIVDPGMRAPDRSVTDAMIKGIDEKAIRTKVTVDLAAKKPKPPKTDPKKAPAPKAGKKGKE